MDARESFGLRLKELRRRAGMSQERLAAAAGVSRTFLGHIEIGQKAPGLEAIVKIAHALGVEAHELLRFGARDTKKPPEELLALPYRPHRARSGRCRDPPIRGGRGRVL